MAEIVSIAQPDQRHSQPILGWSVSTHSMIAWLHEYGDVGSLSRHKKLRSSCMQSYNKQCVDGVVQQLVLKYKILWQVSSHKTLALDNLSIILKLFLVTTLNKNFIRDLKPSLNPNIATAPLPTLYFTYILSIFILSSSIKSSWTRENPRSLVKASFTYIQYAGEKKKIKTF